MSGITNGEFDGNSYSGGGDIFVVKYNSSGTKIWSNVLGNSSQNTATGIISNSSGEVFVGGYTFDGLDGNSSSGGFDLFLVKYDSSGIKQ